MKRANFLAASAVGFLAACGGGGSSAGGGANSTATAFAASLDMTQEVPASVAGVDLQIMFTNNAVASGTYQTPVWFGLHNGTFDTHDSGSPAALFLGGALERIAEDGSTGPISDAFDAAAAGSVQGTIPGPSGPVAPGESGSVTVRVNPMAAASRYFSYVSMVIPSNDAFVANGNPLAHMVFDATGSFVFAGFTVGGAEVLDAGTEVNDELPANTAFFGQAAPDTGADEGANVALHGGFMAPGLGGILDDAMFSAADFLARSYQTLGFSLTVVDANPTAASGAATFTLRADGVTLDYDITAMNLSGPLTGAHFHQAGAGQNGAVVFDVGESIVQNGASATLQGSVVLSAAQLTDVRAGNFYVNLHTSLNSGGEIRGQITATNG